jgi:hypothetical protein
VQLLCRQSDERNSHRRECVPQIVNFSFTTSASRLQLLRNGSTGGIEDPSTYIFANTRHIISTPFIDKNIQKYSVYTGLVLFMYV